MSQDAFLADDFALGVVVFAMAVQDYPWTSTKKGASSKKTVLFLLTATSET